MPGTGSPVPPVIRLLADPLRWRLMRGLAGSDHRVRELVPASGQPQNLIPYASPGRPGAGDKVSLRVLFVCTGNGRVDWPGSREG